MPSHEETPDKRKRRPSSQLRRNLSLCTTEGLVAMPLVYMTLPGNFIVAMLLTKTFPLNETMFGAIASLPAWSNVIQLLLTPLLTRRWSQKAITLFFSWLHLTSWVTLGLALPYVPTDDMEAAGRLFFLLFALSALFQSIVGVSWTSWIQEWVPERIRGKYFGRRNRLLQLSTVVFLLTAGEVLTRIDGDNRVLGMQILILVAVALRAVSIFLQHRILRTSERPEREGGHDIRSQMRVMLQRRPLLWYFAFGAVFGLANGTFGPFFMVFLYDGLQMPVSEVSMLIVISSVTGAIAMPAWGQFLDTHGNRPTMIVALALWMLPGFAWALLTPENTWILKLLYASGGTFSAGFILGQFNFLLKLVPPEAKTASISVNLAVTSLTGALAPILGGYLLETAMTAGYAKLDVYHGMAIIHHAIVPLSGLVLLKVAEPRSASVTRVVGAMRSSRQLFALLGLTFLVNYVFTRRGNDLPARRPARAHRSPASPSPEKENPPRP
ncbi:MAG: MFS transporter [Verrucomicrobia bacterium]|nr:MAG: MFS transporter [Verrucomicrobiota bacterium]